MAEPTKIEIPGGGGQQTPTPEVKAPAIDLDSKIQVDGKSLTVKELLDQAEKLRTMEEKAQKLETYRLHTERLLKGEPEDIQGREESMRYLLTESNFDPEAIEHYVQQALGNTYEPPTEMPTIQQAQQAQPESNREVELLKAKLEFMEQEQQKAKVNTLKRELNTNTGRVLDSNPNLRTLVSKIKDLRGPDGLSEAMDAIKADIQDRTIKQLKLRTASTGQTVNDSWIAEEVDKAADLVYKHYLSVIGDPNRIGRAPETVTGEDIFAKKQPVAPPEFQKGDNMGSATNRLRDFSVDVLSRLAAAGEGSGASKA